MNKGTITTGFKMKEEENSKEKKLTPEQKCQLYACVAWNEMSYKDAKKLVTEKSYEDVDKVTYTNSSIEIAKSGIEKYAKELKSDKKYYAVMKILEEIHDKWVSENAHKYNRDDNRLYQHLPTALIGLEEVAKDAMFLGPFLYEQGIDIGNMTYSPKGVFVLNNEMANVYELYVDVFKEKNNIKAITPAKVQEIVNDYASLQECTAELAMPRINYINEHTELLARQIEEKNPQQFEFKEKEDVIDFSKLSNEELKKYVKFNFDQEGKCHKQ